MKKLNKRDYYILNGHKFFYTPDNLGFQCAYCLYLQQTKFIRNTKGLIIGLDVEPEGETHSDNCFQNKKK